MPFIPFQLPVICSEADKDCEKRTTHAADGCRIGGSLPTEKAEWERTKEGPSDVQ